MVYAAPISTNIPNPLGGTYANISDVLGVVLNVMLGVGWALVFVAACLGIIKFITSHGDPKETAGAKSTLTYIAIGAGILMLVTTWRIIAFGLVNLQGNYGINGVTNFIEK